MNKLNRLLIALPAEFAAIFGRATDDARTEALEDATALPRGATAVVPVESVSGHGSGGTCKSPDGASDRSLPGRTARSRQPA